MNTRIPYLFLVAAVLVLPANRTTASGPLHAGPAKNISSARGAVVHIAPRHIW